MREKNESVRPSMVHFTTEESWRDARAKKDAGKCAAIAEGCEKRWQYAQTLFHRK